MFQIVKYTKEYEQELMEFIKQEGDDWAIYWKEPNATKYKQALKNTLTYIALVDGKVYGYSSSIVDTLFIYVCDLLVTSDYRGNGLGKKLMECLKDDYPGLDIYHVG